MAPIRFDPDFACAADYARLYRQHGLQAVPSHSPEDSPKNWKRPLLSSWKEFETNLASDSQFQKWFGWDGSHKTKKNIGLITGACSDGAFILDVDSHKHPEAAEWLMNLLARYNDGNRLICPTQQTGGGGFQYLLRAPEGWSPPTFRTPIGIDIRGQGGFAVMPPSLHDSGGEYKWIKGYEPWTLDIPKAAEWLTAEIDLLVRKYTSSVNRNTSYGETGSSVITTNQPQYAKTEFGRIIDGREEYMTRYVWGVVVNMHRELLGQLPSAVELKRRSKEAFNGYLLNAKSRLNEHGTTDADLLEREGRGLTEWNRKWDYAIQQWDDKVALHASQLPEKEVNSSGESAEVGIQQEKDYLEQIRLLIANDLEASPDLIDQALPPLWIVDQYLPVAGASLAGTGGAGKTTLTLNEYVRISNGMDLYGSKVTEGGVCVIVTAEDGANYQRYLLKHILQSGFDSGQLTQEQVKLAKSRIKIVNWDRSRYGSISKADRNGNFDRNAIFDLLLELLIPHGSKVVTLDPLSLFSAGERYGNDGEAFTAAMIHGAALELKCFFQVLDHVSQETARSGAVFQHAARGGTAKTDNARLARQLITYKESTNKTFGGEVVPIGITPEDLKEGRILQLHCTKSNYAPKRSVIWLRRSGYWMQHLESVPSDQVKLIRKQQFTNLEAEEERKCIELVTELLKSGQYPNQTLLESEAPKQGLSKNVMRTSVKRCTAKRKLIEVDLPKNLVRGARKVYLAPPDWSS